MAPLTSGKSSPVESVTPEIPSQPQLSPSAGRNKYLTDNPPISRSIAHVWAPCWPQDLVCSNHAAVPRIGLCQVLLQQQGDPLPFNRQVLELVAGTGEHGGRARWQPRLDLASRHGGAMLRGEGVEGEGIADDREQVVRHGRVVDLVEVARAEQIE